MRAITRDTWRLDWFVDQLYRFSDAPMHWCAYDVSAPASLFGLVMVFAKRAWAHVCVHVTDSRTRAKSKFSHSVTSFRSKLLHTSQRLSTSWIFFTFILVKLRNIASAIIIKRSYSRRNSLLTWRNSYIRCMHLEIFFSCTRFFTSALITFALLVDELN